MVDAWKDARLGGKASGANSSGGSGSGGAWAEDAEATALRYEMLAAVSEPRLQNVLSKIGHVDADDRQQCRRVFDDLVQDIEETLVQDGLVGEAGELQRKHGEVYQDLCDAARKLVTSFLRTELRNKRASRTPSPPGATPAPSSAGSAAEGGALSEQDSRNVGA